ncbi:hypothetical protein ABZ626_19500 [Streptomyces longispororuber]|uniref:hypothetical protein n=1 Tax=Streptomyces longispororuber TaxID=68230 RepID=UPI0033DDE4F2
MGEVGLLAVAFFLPGLVVFGGVVWLIVWWARKNGWRGGSGPGPGGGTGGAGF